jgi:ketosteroid isomerase-like protein
LSILRALAVGLAAVGCAAAAPSGLASSSSPQARLAAVRAELEATFEARQRAFEAKDFATLVAQISPDYLAIRPDGTRMSRDDLAGYIRRNLDRWVRIVSQSNRIESLRLEGGNAVVDMRQRLARIQIVDGREALVESGVLQTETWTPTRDGWKLLAVRDERERKVTVDGRPVG